MEPVLSAESSVLLWHRTFMECYWFSVDRTRWSRMTHALRMGREYTEPFQGFGKGDKHEISSLCKYILIFLSNSRSNANT